MSKDIQEQPQSAEGDAGLAAHFGQPSGNPNSQQQTSVEKGASDGQPQYVTQADLEKIRQDAIDEARRTAQSISDKAASTSRKAYQEAKAEIDRLKKLGLQMTPQQEEAIRDQKLSAMMNEEGAGQAGEQQPQSNIQKPKPQQQAAAPPKWLQDDVNELIADAGFNLVGQDFQDAGLTPQLMQENPRKFYDTYKAALDAKREEIRKGGQPRRGAVPAMGSGGSSVGLEAQCKKEMMAAKGNQQKINEIRKRYSEQGVDISQIKFFG